MSSSNIPGEENQFQEQLIMDKMALEEAVQEKTVELEQALEHIKELQAQLNERRQQVNQLRQEQEDMTETLLQAQRQLITQHQMQEDQNWLPLNESTHSHTQIQQEYFAKDTTQGSDDSFAISFKMNTTTAVIVDGDTSTNQTFECKAIEKLDKDEMQINFVTLSETIRKEETAFASNDVEISPSKDRESASDWQDRLGRAASLDVEMKQKLVTAMEDKIHLETKLREAAAVLEEKTILELKVKELLLVVQEKQAVIAQLQKSDKHSRLPAETDGLEAANQSIPLEYEFGGGDTVVVAASLLAKLDRLSGMEQCLEQNIQLLEQTKEEKAALEIHVHEMEIKLEQLASAEKSLQNFSLSQNVQKLSAEVDSLQTQLHPVQTTDGDSGVEQLQTQNSKLSQQVETLTSKTELLQAQLEQVQSTKESEVDVERLLSENCTLIKQVDSLSSEVESLHTELLAAKVKDKSVDESLLQHVVEKADGCTLSEKTQNLSLQLEQSSEVESLQLQIDLLKSENRLHSEKNQCLEKETEKTKVELAQLQAEVQKYIEIKEMLQAKVEELTSTLEQKQGDQEEINAELIWQTKTCEELQKRVEELEAEVAEHKQEAEDLMQELEKAQKLQDDSEQIRHVVEETLENFKAHSAKLEQELQTLATERDEIELKEESALKEIERLEVEFKISSDHLEGKLAAAEMELRTAVDGKEVLEAALADRESAQHMSGLLHDKLYTELKESQLEVMSLKTSLSRLEMALKGKEFDFAIMQKLKEAWEADKGAVAERMAALKVERDLLAECQVNLTAEKEELVRTKVVLETEKNKLKESLAAEKVELKNAALNHNEKLEILHQAIKNEKKTKAAQREEIAAHLEEIAHLKADVNQLKKQVDSSNCKTMKLQGELEAAHSQCQQMTQRVLQTESRCRLAEQQNQEAIVRVQQLQLAIKEMEKKLATSNAQCSQLQDELGEKIESLEKLKKDLDVVQSNAANSSTYGEKMVPLLEVKKEKFILKNRIRHLTQDLENAKEGMKCQEFCIKVLQEKVSKYENDEQEDKDEKIETLQNDLKSKDMEIAGIKLQLSEELGKIKKKLSNAEEMINYKEQVINRLKGEIRRNRSEEVSFCAPAAPKPFPEPTKTTGSDERVISSHSGIIDRYTVTLLEADKYKFQKELKKTQERLKARESELHRAKVALAKAKLCVSPTASSSVESLTSTTDNTDVNDCDVKWPTLPSLTVDKLRQDLASELPLLRKSADCFSPEQQLDQRPLSQTEHRLGTSVDGDLEPRSSSSVTRTLSLQDDPNTPRLHISNSGTSVDIKKEKYVLPSATDKENAPFGTEVSTKVSGKTGTSTFQSDVEATEDSPLQIEPRFWEKKPQVVPPVTRKTSSRLAGKVKLSMGKDEQCKTQ